MVLKIEITFSGGTDINEACRRVMDLWCKLEGREKVIFNFNGVEITCFGETTVQTMVDEYFERVSELQDPTQEELGDEGE